MSYTDRREYFTLYREKNREKFIHKAIFRELNRHETRMVKLFRKCGCWRCMEAKVLRGEYTTTDDRVKAVYD